MPTTTLRKEGVIRTKWDALLWCAARYLEADTCNEIDDEAPVPTRGWTHVSEKLPELIHAHSDEQDDTEKLALMLEMNAELYQIISELELHPCDEREIFLSLFKVYLQWETGGLEPMSPIIASAIPDSRNCDVLRTLAKWMQKAPSEAVQGPFADSLGEQFKAVLILIQKADD